MLLPAVKCKTLESSFSIFFLQWSRRGYYVRHKKEYQRELTVTLFWPSAFLRNPLEITSAQFWFCCSMLPFFRIFFPESVLWIGGLSIVVEAFWMCTLMVLSNIYSRLGLVRLSSEIWHIIGIAFVSVTYQGCKKYGKSHKLDVYWLLLHELLSKSFIYFWCWDYPFTLYIIFKHLMDFSED